MKRREFIAALGGAAAWPFVARAQHAGAPLIAVLSPAAATGSALPDNIDAFVRGLRAKGYIDKQNVNLEFRFAGWQLDQLPRLVAELVALKPNVLFNSHN
jgi:putative tryptophan/tyrosine transport system substrate-binding protein